MFAFELEVALAAVRSASIACQKVFKRINPDDCAQKQDHSPVTIADYASQYIISTHLHRAFPNDAIIAEEDAADIHPDLLEKIVALLKSCDGFEGVTGEMVLDVLHLEICNGTGRFWTIDPVDGTKGFLRGGQYAVCLALIEDGVVKVGVLGCPNLLSDLANPDSARGCLVYAITGQGAFQIVSGDSEPRQLNCNDTLTSDSSFVESVESGHSSHDTQRNIGALLEISKSVRMDSQCKYAVIARGCADVYLRIPTALNAKDTRGEKKAVYVEKIWDHAAGSLIVQEAGGWVGDCYGNALDFGGGYLLSKNVGVLACGRGSHVRVVDAVKRTLDI